MLRPGLFPLNFNLKKKLKEKKKKKKNVMPFEAKVSDIVFNIPGVAGVTLQTSLSLIK